MYTATQILTFLEFSAKLKLQLRSFKLSENRFESVADHSFQLTLFVLLTHEALEQPIDLLKCLKLSLFHDLVEADFGDTPYGLAENNYQIRVNKQKNEIAEIEKIKNNLGGSLGQEIYDLWHEYEAGQTTEAKYIKALNSLEANFQSVLFKIDYWDKAFYPIALTKADQFCQDEPILIELNRKIKEKMLELFKKERY
ncbi:MAG: HD domain-containing protein [Candidatus Falkowbacteria bacterium]